MLEVEQRAFLDQMEFDRISSLLEKEYGIPEKQISLTILLRGQNSHGRVRCKAGENDCTFTMKSGEAGDNIRRETNKTAALSELMADIDGYQFDKALSFVTKRQTFKKGDTSIEISDHGVFGNILETEVLLPEDSNSQAIDQAKTEVANTLTDLGLNAVDSGEYKKYMDYMFEQKATPFDKSSIKENIATFQNEYS